MFRQGDVLIVPVSEDQVPAAVQARAAQPRDGRGRMILALGEATGHAHAVVGRGDLFPAPLLTEPAWLRLPEGGKVVHEEHAMITLPAGWFRIVRQREYVPGAVRVVAD
jgi:hypothetical protein